MLIKVLVSISYRRYERIGGRSRDRSYKRMGGRRLSLGEVGEGSEEELKPGCGGREVFFIRLVLKHRLEGRMVDKNNYNNNSNNNKLVILLISFIGILIIFILGKSVIILKIH